MKEQLISRLTQKQSKIAIIGLGYVGLPLAFTYIEAGYSVLGVDIDQDKIKQLLRGQSYIPRITEQQLLTALDKQFECTSDISCVTEADAIILCVPTPLSKYREPDLSYVTQTVESLLPHLRAGQIISLESTTYPGTTEEVLKPALEMSGLKVGLDIFLAYSPEREDPGNESYTTRT
ncbi:MAG TPA: NAD(P)-binding domain-containing protein, partial [Gammaproteobacteria bacterium]|nr:NAD(P)-binding domain-containing protein [Gammaproteobacteria bacterium]